MFNPNEHLMKIGYKDKAKDYLPVQWRLVWFRECCPQGTIDTEELEYDLDRDVSSEESVWSNEKKRMEKVVKVAKGYARYRAIVTDGKGGRATGTKSENAASFPDFGEKAETGAIGRALAALGYGTQFTGDEFEEKQRIVDSPVDRHMDADETDAVHPQADKSKRNGNRQPQAKPSNVVPMPQKPSPSAVTKEQVNALYDAGKAAGHWQSINGMCAFASAELGINLAREDFLNLTAEQYQHLVKAVEQETAGAGAGQ